METGKLQVDRSRSSEGVECSDFRSFQLLYQLLVRSKNLKSQLLLSSENEQLKVVEFSYQDFLIFLTFGKKVVSRFLQNPSEFGQTSNDPISKNTGAIPIIFGALES